MSFIVKNPLDKLPDILKKDLDSTLCVCNDVNKMEIIETIADGADTVEAVRRKTYATDGSGCCKRDVSRLIECIHEIDLGL